MAGRFPDPATSPSRFVSDGSAQPYRLSWPQLNGLEVGVAPAAPPGAQLSWATGTMTVREGNRLLGTVPIAKPDEPMGNPYAHGVLDIDLLPGYHPLTLDYSGDANFQPNRATVSVDIPNAEVIASVPGSPVDGQPYTVEVQVVPLPGVSGIPTGKVRNAEDFAQPSFEATLDAHGRATITMQQRPSSSSSTNPISAHLFIEYLGDSTFVPSRTLVQFTILPSTAA
ncbi:hypothetical protein AB1460_12115 [Parafrankia sp. FMc2]